jgi:hypothetical protein
MTRVSLISVLDRPRAISRRTSVSRWVSAPSAGSGAESWLGWNAGAAPMTGVRLVRLYAVGRRVPAAAIAIAACAIGLRIALLGHLRLAVTAVLTAAAIGLLCAAARRRPVLDRTDGVPGRGGVRALHAGDPD